MKHLSIPAAAMILAMILALFATTAMAQVRGSKHDLGSTGAAQQVTASTSEVCAFCHTPHGSNTGVAAPLWNKTIPGTTYQRYSDLATATLDGSEVAVGSVSLACLSCHDGTQAMDVVLNSPGSGGYNSAGAEIDAVAIGVMNEGTNPVGSPIPNLGSDLRDDHPVSIAYAGGACENILANCDPSVQATGDPDFRTAKYASINGNPNWWVDTEGTPNDQRNKTDMILYTRTFTNPGPSVECGSCHDPHEGGSTPVSFMRINNDNSNVCLACHIK